MNGSPTANNYWLPPSGGGFLLAFDYRLTRKRVFEFLETHLITSYVLLELVVYIFLYRLFVPPHGIHIVPPALEVPVPILVLEICVAIEYHQTTLSFEVSYYLRHTVLGRYCHI